MNKLPPLDAVVKLTAAAVAEIEVAQRGHVVTRQSSGKATAFHRFIRDLEPIARGAGLAPTARKDGLGRRRSGEQIRGPG
jgi:hypothetical protein